MRTKIVAVLAAAGLLLGSGAFISTAALPEALASGSAEAAVTKSLGGQGGAGSAAGAGNRFGNLLSGWGVPAITALAGCLLIGALATRNIGASVGIVAITLLSLIFLLAPQSVESFAKGIANVVF
jgi:hypothetical protein